MSVYVCYLIAYIIRKMDEKFKQIYYSDDGYWRGKSAIQKLSKGSGLTKKTDRKMATAATIVPNIFTSTKIHSRI